MKYRLQINAWNQAQMMKIYNDIRNTNTYDRLKLAGGEVDENCIQDERVELPEADQMKQWDDRYEPSEYPQVCLFIDFEDLEIVEELKAIAGGFSYYTISYYNNRQTETQKFWTYYVLTDFSRPGSAHDQTMKEGWLTA